MSTYKSLLTEVRELKRVASVDYKEKLLSLLNSGEIDPINQALSLNDTLGILTDQEIGQVLAPMVMDRNEAIREQWKTLDSLGWELLKTIPNHPMWNNLKELYLTNTDLSSIPKEIRNLTNLEVLELVFSSLSSLPSEIGKLTNLKQLALTNTNLSSLPSWIGNLKNLIVLGLSYNNLTSIPKEIGNLKNLKRLGLYGNNLSSLPKEIGNLTKLEYLYLGGNYLTIEDVPKHLLKVTKM